MPLTSPRLWVVATPLGNPGDFSPRAREALKSADLVLVEDTRRASRLFAQHKIPAKKFLSFYEHNEHERQESLLELLRAGQTLALISDAGTPLLADPGYRLVRACRKEGIPVSPIPGPSAPAAALSVAGIPPIPYIFLGFLPRDQAGRERLFAAFAEAQASLVFFERKNRLKQSLALAHRALGARDMAICREMTKTHEEFLLIRLEEHDALSDNFLGEITVLVGPPETITRTPDDDVRQLLQTRLVPHEKPRDTVRRIQYAVQGWTTKELYALVSENRTES
ncbi:MAG: 16S rRNA (cytidine1402-2'-O)-methyltransferase [Candidatus Desulfovibrio kirbyi]|uniref:Ribosomal RNA small subunit methyltransferase I n=1 Tax=Candidatus Desulfovibrio kirbyi TaxID=2696086 RepID=A0A6L2R5I2_9BACT|nr:MAG: 16S rRNA (cytidine1402-2'-O)-methyltransferase [Candidatus Desulfovibrio kirbyi]